MKKYIYCSLFLSFFMLQSYTGNAQKYHPMALEGAHWIIGWDRLSPPWLDRKYSFTVRGDTIVNEQEYKKVYQEFFEFDEETKRFSNRVGNPNLYALMRDDTIARKVYAITQETLYQNCPINEEYLLFDFSVKEGDTLKWCSLDGLQLESDVSLADSIRMHKSYYLDEFRNTIYTRFGAAGYMDGSVVEMTVPIIEGFGHEFIGPFLDGSFLIDYCLGTNRECGLFPIIKNDWFPIGAEWYYTKGSTNSFSQRFLNPRITKDTLIGLQMARIWSQSGQLEFIYAEDNDKVYRYDKDLKQWFLLYDFSAQPGDTLSIHFRDNQFFEIVVDSFTQIELAGDTFDVQHFHQTLDGDIRVDWGSRNIRFLGNDQFIFPQMSIAGVPTGPIRCYSPKPEKLYSLVSFACDLVPVFENVLEKDFHVNIYPNPSNDFIQIDIKGRQGSEKYYRLFSSIGRVVKEGNLMDEQIHVSELPSGLYFISISLDKSTTYTQFIIKK